MKPTLMKKLLLAAVASAALAGPIAADAQPNPNREETREERQQNRENRQKQRQGNQQQNQKQRQDAQQAAQKQRQDARPNGPGQRPGQGQRPNRQGPIGQQQGQNANNNPQVRTPPNRPGQNRPGQNRPGQQQQNNNNANNGGVVRRALTPERQRVRRNAQSQIQRNFNRNNWQNNFRRNHSNRNWWRNDRRFRGWNGVRVGFYFSPGYGYYNVPRSYYNRRYSEGSYLPSFFWRYRVNDYNSYGLPPAPPGTAWVYVNNAILLVDLYDGYVITAIYDVWYW